MESQELVSNNITWSKNAFAIFSMLVQSILYFLVDSLQRAVFNEAPSDDSRSQGLTVCGASF